MTQKARNQMADMAKKFFSERIEPVLPTPEDIEEASNEAMKEFFQEIGIDLPKEKTESESDKSEESND